MLFIGTMNIARTREQGEFYCPSCESIQSYRLRAKRPWLTLYFVPVIPIGSVELIIQCKTCKSNWDTSVLNVSAESHQRSLSDQVHEEIFRSMTLFVLSDGYMTPDEVEPLRDLASRIFEREVDREELGKLCSLAEQSSIPVKNYVESVARKWTVEQQKLAIQVMFLGASLRGELGEERIAVLMRMRELAGLSEAEFQELVEACLRWNEL